MLSLASPLQIPGPGPGPDPDPDPSRRPLSRHVCPVMPYWTGYIGLLGLLELQVAGISELTRD